MSKFKVGARVIPSSGIIDDEVVKGVGTVVAWKFGIPMVEWDEHHDFMHDGGGLGKPNHCWWCFSADDVLALNMENV